MLNIVNKRIQNWTYSNDPELYSGRRRIPVQPERYPTDHHNQRGGHVDLKAVIGLVIELIDWKLIKFLRIFLGLFQIGYLIPKLYQNVQNAHLNHVVAHRTNQLNLAE